MMIFSVYKEVVKFDQAIFDLLRFYVCFSRKMNWFLVSKLDLNFLDSEQKHLLQIDAVFFNWAKSYEI